MTTDPIASLIEADPMLVAQALQDAGARDVTVEMTDDGAVVTTSNWTYEQVQALFVNGVPAGTNTVPLMVRGAIARLRTKAEAGNLDIRDLLILFRWMGTGDK